MAESPARRGRWRVAAVIVLLALILLLDAGGIGLLPAPASDGPHAEATDGRAVGTDASHAAAPNVRPSSGGNTVLTTLTNVSSPLEATFDPDNGEVYVPDSTEGDLAGTNSSNLTVISGTTNQVVDVIYQGEGANLETPTYVSYNHEIYVPNDNETGLDTSNNVTAFSATNDLVANIDAGVDSFPSTGVYDPVNEILYVGDESTESFLATGDNVTAINVTTNTVAQQIPVGLGPITGVYDPADGLIYVPDNGYGETNLSIINGTTNTVQATLTDLQQPITPVYDPVSQEVYVVDEASNNLTVVKGTAVVATIPIESAGDGGFQLGSPAVDTSNGDIYIPVYVPNEILVVSPENTVVTTISGGADYLDNEQPTFDPVNGYLYAPGENSETGNGLIYAISTATNSVTVEIPVGLSPQTPTFDSANDDLYVPGLDDNTVTVINGSAVASSPPGTFSVTFTESGLPSGAYWNVLLNSTRENRSTSSIAFTGVGDGKYPFEIGPWADEDSCVLSAASPFGNVTVSGADASELSTFVCAGTPGGGGRPGGASGGSSGFLGLSGDDGYFLLIGIVVIVVVAAAVLAVRSRRAPPPTSGGPGGFVPPPPPLPSPPPPPPP